MPLMLLRAHMGLAFQTASSYIVQNKTSSTTTPRWPACATKSRSRAK